MGLGAYTSSSEEQRKNQREKKRIEMGFEGQQIFDLWLTFIDCLSNSVFEILQSS